MKTFTTKEIIKAVPLPDEVKERILKEYDSYDDATKFEIIHACSNAFDDMYIVIQKARYQQFLNEVVAGTREMKADFMHTVREAVDRDIEDFISGKKHETDEIEGVRKQLQGLMSKNTA